MTNLETLKQKTADMEAKLNELKAEIDRLENGWEMKPTLDDDDVYYYLTEEGEIDEDSWSSYSEDLERFEFGNIFKTYKEAVVELKRKKLLAKFRAFRDECNGDWKPDWSDSFKSKYYLEIIDSKVVLDSVNYANRIATFGYFKNEEDAYRAIELFGDEIKELFAEV